MRFRSGGIALPFEYKVYENPEQYTHEFFTSINSISHAIKLLHEFFFSLCSSDVSAREREARFM